MAALCTLAAWGAPGGAPAQATSPPCFGWQPPQAPGNELSKGFTRELFTSRSFRLGSDVYATGTPAGFPIRFMADGTVESENLQPHTRWWVQPNSALHLETADGAAARTFRYSDRCHTLLFEVHREEGSYTVEIRLVE
jgi:hypothetical protein